MNGPKHLWSGDWEQESEAAAARRRGAAPLPAPAPDPVPVPERTLASERPQAPLSLHSSPLAGRPPRRWRRVPWRALGITLMTALIIIAVALGLIALSDSGAGQPAAARPGWLGLQLGVLSNGSVVVTGLERGSPAGAAGVHVGDVITDVQSRPVAAPVDVALAVDALQAGETIELGGERGTHTYTVRVRLAPRSGAQRSP